MAKKGRAKAKKQGFSNKDKLEKEMLTYYESLNQQKKPTVEEQRVVRNRQALTSLVLSIVITVILSLLAWKYYPSSIVFLLLFSAVIFISLFANIGFLLDKDEGKHRFWIGIVVQLLIVLVMFGQLQISSIQTEILRNSNPPYYPDIRIVPDYKDLVVPSFELVDLRNFENNWDVEHGWAKVKMTIYNQFPKDIYTLLVCSVTYFYLI